MSKQYIDSPEQWEDSVNADYDKREQENKQEDNREQPYPITEEAPLHNQDANIYINRAIEMLKEYWKDEWLIAGYNGIVSLLRYAKESHEYNVYKSEREIADINAKYDIPLTQQESEDELWQEVKETFDAIFNERYTVAHKLFLKLKQDYSLTRKQPQ